MDNKKKIVFFINFGNQKGKTILTAEDAAEALAKEFKKNGGDPSQVFFTFMGRPFAWEIVKNKETLFKAFVEEDGKIKLFPAP